MGAASMVASVTDVSVLAISRRAGVAVGVAAFLGCLAGGVANFAALRRKVFARATTSVAASALRYGLLVVVGGALITALLCSLGVSLGAPLVVVRPVVGGLVLALWGYPISKRVVFKEET